jgi:hypothetical protein
MPRPKGTPKTGGRKIGSRNKPLASVLARLSQLKCDPVKGLATIAAEAHENDDGELAAYCYRCLLPYVYPRLGILDVKVTDDTGTAQRLEAALERMRQAFAQPQPVSRQVPSIIHAPLPPVIDALPDSAGRPHEGSAAPGATRLPTRPEAPVAPSGESNRILRPEPLPWLAPAQAFGGERRYIGGIAHDPVQRDDDNW